MHQLTLAAVSRRALAALGLLGLALFYDQSAAAETVIALPGVECREVRQALETYVPIAPGFRQLEMPFPENQEQIKGSLCRLVAVGTGVHIENEQVRTLTDLQAYMKRDRLGGDRTDRPLCRPLKARAPCFCRDPQQCNLRHHHPGRYGAGRHATESSDRRRHDFLRLAPPIRTRMVDRRRLFPFLA